MYSTLFCVLFGMKVPEPPDHSAPVAPAKVPESWMVSLFEQPRIALPASIVGEGVKLIVTSSDSALHTPGASVVIVKVNGQSSVNKIFFMFIDFSVNNYLILILSILSREFSYIIYCY